jgi:glutamate-1-semialdehyde 2,1-aminomutase
MDVVVKGEVPHLGTHNGNPLAVAAAIAAVGLYRDQERELYPRLEGLSRRLAAGLSSEASGLGAPLHVHAVGPLLQTFVAPADADMTSYAGTREADASRHALFAEQLLDRGVMILPRGWWFLSAAHTPEDIDETVRAAGEALASVAAG